MKLHELYIVDTHTEEYLCIAVEFNLTWSPINLEDYEDFLGTRLTNYTGRLVIESSRDKRFYRDWIENGIKFNK